MPIENPGRVWATTEQSIPAHGQTPPRTVQHLADGSLLVAIAPFPRLSITRVGAGGSVLSSFVVTIPVAANVSSLVASAEGEVYVLGWVDGGSSVISKWDALSGRILWNALQVDEFGSLGALAVHPGGDLVIAGVAPWGNGAVLAHLRRFDGAFVTAPTLLSTGYSKFQTMSLDPDGNAVVIGGDPYSYYSALSVGKVSTKTGLEIWGPLTLPDTSASNFAGVLCASNGDVVLFSQPSAGGAATVSRFSGESGALLWRTSVSGEYGTGAFALDGAGDVYAYAYSYYSSTSGFVRLDGISGGVVWSVPTPWGVPTQLVVDGGGAVTVVNESSSTSEARVFRLSHADGSTVWGPVALVPAQDRVLLTTPAGDPVVVSDSTGGPLVQEMSAASGTVLRGPVPVHGAARTATYSWRQARVDGAGDVVLAGGCYYYSSTGAGVPKVSGVTGARIWGPVVLPAVTHTSSDPVQLRVGPGGDVYVVNPTESSSGGSLRRLSGSDGSTVWGPLALAGSVVGLELDGAGDLVVLRRELDSQYRSSFAVEKRRAATWALAWGPVVWRSPQALNDVPTALRVDSLGNVVVVGRSSIDQNVAARGVALAYSGANGSLLWGPLAFDDFNRGVGQVFLDQGPSASVFVATVQGSSSFTGYPVLVRRIDTATGNPIWPPLAPVLPTPYISGYMGPWKQVADGRGDLLVMVATAADGYTTAKLRSGDGCPRSPESEGI